MLRTTIRQAELLTEEDIFPQRFEQADATVGVLPTQTVQHQIHTLRGDSEKVPPFHTFTEFAVPF